MCACVCVVVLSQGEGDGRRGVQLQCTAGVTLSRGDGQLRVQVTSLLTKKVKVAHTRLLSVGYWS